MELDFELNPIRIRPKLEEYSNFGAMSNHTESTPKKVVDEMFRNDHFSQWLGIERLNDGVGVNTLKMAVKREMLNGFNILHGGVTFAFADSALAFAANSHGTQCLSIENSIHYHAKAMEGDLLLASAKEVSRSNKIAVYQVDVTNQREELIASFKGSVYRTGRDWQLDTE